MKRKKVTNELIASFLYSSRQLTASTVQKMLHKCSDSQQHVTCKSISAKAKRDMGKPQVTTPVCRTLWRLVMSNGRSFQNRLYFTVLFGAGLLPKHY